MRLPTRARVMMICHFNFPLSKICCWFTAADAASKSVYFLASSPCTHRREGSGPSPIVGISRNARLFFRDRSVVKTTKTALLLS